MHGMMKRKSLSGVVNRECPQLWNVKSPSPWWLEIIKTMVACKEQKQQMEGWQYKDIWCDKWHEVKLRILCFTWFFMTFASYTTNPTEHSAAATERSMRIPWVLAKQWPSKSVECLASAQRVLDGNLQVILIHFCLSSAQWLLSSARWD